MLTAVASHSLIFSFLSILLKNLFLVLIYSAKSIMSSYFVPIHTTIGGMSVFILIKFFYSHSPLLFVKEVQLCLEAFLCESLFYLCS